MFTQIFPKYIQAVLVFALSFMIIMFPLSANLMAAESIVQEEQNACLDAERQAQSDVSGSTWFVIGCLAGVLGWVIALVAEPSPPATALMGKSPEYVATYTDCYKKKGKEIKSKNSLIGCLVGGGLTAVAYVVMLAVAYSE